MKLRELTEMMDPESDMDKIVAHWKEKSKDMTKDEVLDAIADELEQLEYSPEEIDSMLIPTILKKLGK